MENRRQRAQKQKPRDIQITIAPGHSEMITAWTQVVTVQMEEWTDLRYIMKTKSVSQGDKKTEKSRQISNFGDSNFIFIIVWYG